MSLNKAMLIGHLGHDPEFNHTKGGKAVAHFSLATHEGKDANGEKKTEWHKIVAWEKVAETCQKYLKKGSLVFIEGRLATSKWKDKQNQERTSTEIIADRMHMLDRKPDAAAENKTVNTEKYEP